MFTIAQFTFISDQFAFITAQILPVAYYEIP